MMCTAIYLECDQCKTRTPAIDGAVFSHRELRGEAKSAGWLRTRGSSGLRVDLCPTCRPRKKGRAQ